MDAKSVEDLMTFLVVGIILGGRLGYVLFYNLPYFIANPVDIPKVWQGGMSFHGGFAGVVLGAVYFGLRRRINLWSLGDMIAASVPFGLLLGRIANFINGELWGRPTTASWGMFFPFAPECPDDWLLLCTRHPSQLYEAALEGAVLAVVIAYLIWRRGWLRMPGRIMGVFLAGYGAARIFIEQFREPDIQFITLDNPAGHVIALGEFGLTMGQVLSLPMLLIGLAFIVWRRHPA